MRLSEDVIRYMTVKQEGPLPAARSSAKNSTKADDKNPETKVESKEKQPVESANISTSEKKDTTTKENTES